MAYCFAITGAMDLAGYPILPHTPIGEAFKIKFDPL